MSTESTARPSQSNGRSHRTELPIDLLVVAGDNVCEEAARYLDSRGVGFRLIEVSPDDYSSPRDVPKLLTNVGAYIGLDGVKEAVETEQLVSAD